MAMSEESSSSAGGSLRAIAVDDSDRFRVALRELIDATPGFEVVDVAESGERAVEVVRRHRPDLVIMDVNMPGVDGIEATRSIKTELPSTVVVLVSATHPDDLSLRDAEQLADAIVWKSRLRPALISEIWRHRGRPHEEA